MNFDLKNIILIAEIVVSALLVLTILLQHRGAGLSSVFGGSGNIYRTKRGLEKGLFYLTIVLIILFVTIGIVNLAISA
ncbi:MAG: Preprotein translocase, SecG subunit [Parcubacteria group bacterium GW2011_GWA2_51_12]|nr:MAG: Preprotein translocase, SecG subunit [Parcubacteria group bacterium GW2011_GWA2_51_12]